MSAKPGFGLLSGLWFHFEVDNEQISVHGSAWSGLERVWVNDELASQKRSLGRASSHHVRVGERELEVHFITTDMVRGVVECEVRDAEDVLRHSRLSYIPEEATTWKFLLLDAPPSWKVLLSCMAVGSVIGVVVGYYGWW